MGGEQKDTFSNELLLKIGAMESRISSVEKIAEKAATKEDLDKVIEAISKLEAATDSFSKLVIQGSGAAKLGYVMVAISGWVAYKWEEIRLLFLHS